MANLIQTAWAGLRKTPLFSLAVILCIAIGIGVNTAIFAGVRAVLLRPLPTPELDRLVAIRNEMPGLALHSADLSPAEVKDLEMSHDLFESMAGFSVSELNMTGEAEPRRVTVVSTLGDFFTVFRATPAVGTLYQSAESYTRGRSLLLSSAFWTQHYGRDMGVLGKILSLDGVPYRIVGVLTDDFRYPRTADLYVPFNYDERWPARRGTLIMTTVGRPRPGVSFTRIGERMREEAARWHARPELSADYERFKQRLDVVPFVEFLAGQLRPVMLLLVGAVALVLLIACANVVSLQLVRGIAQRRDLAIRSALGASPTWLAVLLLTESALLVTAGGLLGIGAGSAIARLLARWAPPQQGLLSEAYVDAQGFGLTMLVMVAMALLLGALPAYRAFRADPVEALQEGSRTVSGGRGQRRFLRVVVAMEIALATVLLLTSGLLLRSLDRMLTSDVGFRPASVLTANVSLSRDAFATSESVILFYGELLTRLRNVPGVVKVGLASSLPFTGRTDSSPFQIVGQDVASTQAQPHANLQIVSDGYFPTLGIPLLRGRLFTDLDDAASPLVVVVDEQLAKQFFPNVDPLGREIGYDRPARIIGIVGAINDRVSEGRKATMYYSYRQRGGARTMVISVRSRLEPAAGTAAIRRAVTELTSTVPIYDVREMPDRVAEAFAPRRYASTVVGGFALLALALALLGIYGVVSPTTAQRGRELLIRVALGAAPRSVALTVLGDAGVTTLIGVGLGVTTFLSGSRLLTAQLYDIGPGDPVTLVGGVAVVAAMSLVATYLPARRASRLDAAAITKE